MRAAHFSILAIERRHETAGLIATDLVRRAEVWLVDIGLESSMPDGGSSPPGCIPWGVSP
jgi:hypothetical protein